MAELTQDQIALLQKLAVESKGAMNFVSGSSDANAQGGYVIDVAMPEGGRQMYSPTEFLQLYQESRDRLGKIGNVMSAPCPRGEVLELLKMAAEPLQQQNAGLDSK